MKRRTFVKNVGIASATMVMPSLYGNINFLDDEDFSLMDLHVHTTDEFTIDVAMKIAAERKVKFGILAHPHDFGLKDDVDLKKYIDNLKKTSSLYWSSTYDNQLDWKLFS